MIIGTKIKLRNKRLADARDDYTWQSDSELARLDAIRPLTMSFSRYLSNYTDDLRYSSSSKCRFAIETLDGKQIGNCSYYNITYKKNACSIWQAF